MEFRSKIIDFIQNNHMIFLVDRGRTEIMENVIYPFGVIPGRPEKEARMEKEIGSLPGRQIKTQAEFLKDMVFQSDKVRRYFAVRESSRAWGFAPSFTASPKKSDCRVG
ncbi:MAG: hypothetical protein MZV49_00165 [Rhodopseudomonas palustris]|nr:hypothetical protein [Rhodopseudomonas palustris]